MNLLQSLLAVLGAYAIGSIPFGLVTARLVAGIDIRREGSGNIGATNVARVVGARWGFAVLLFDALKGLLPVFILPRLLLTPESPNFSHLQVACGMAAILGHVFPCWLGFRGGKGVATALGVVLILAPWASLVAAAGFGLTIVLFRIVSLSSVIAALLFAAVQMWLLKPQPFGPDNWSLGAFSLAVPLLIVWRHRSNLVRLWRGDEKRLQFGRRSGNACSESAGESPLQKPGGLEKEAVQERVEEETPTSPRENPSK